METTLEYIKNRFNVDVTSKDFPIEIPNTNRETLATMFAELGFEVGAEVGVEAGLYSEVLLRNNPNLTLFSIDAWTAYNGYRDHVTQSKLDAIQADATDRLKDYANRNIIIKGFSVEEAQKVNDNSLDFVYIDANHEFQHVVNDIAEWHKKVKPGGIIAGHDYIKRKTTHKKQEYLMHVIPAVHGFLEAYKIKPLFVLGSKAKIEGELRDSPRSWFYVKPKPRSVVPGHGTLDKKD